MSLKVKDFSAWNIKKQQLELRDASELYFRTREIWFCSIGVNIGFEEDGKHSEFERPVIIYRKFSQHVFWGISLTTRIKPNNSYYVELRHGGIRYAAIISQLRLYDARRLQRYLYTVDNHQFMVLRERVKALT